MFGGLGDEELKALAALFEERRFERGQVIFQEGDLGREMFYLRQGEVSILTTASSGELEEVARLGAGQCFGEMALIEIAPRSACVRAVEPLLTLVLTARDLHELRKAYPDAYTLIVMNLARELSRRLRRLDKVFVEERLPRRARERPEGSSGSPETAPAQKTERT